MTNNTDLHETEAKKELKEELRNTYKVHARLARECYHDGRMTFEECLDHIIDLRDWLADAIDAVEENRLYDIRKPFH